ncbi:hypothetical protein K4G60_g1442 [Candida parapsilosis]|nr:hypothetical protein K4G60_g1442 [Candida parapsilosis]KAI5906671.1 hypothetical protein K4G61_g330 [Candida parapsilosis]CAD1811079.1 unnamed protein product [Candida parapsilosis]
MNLSDLPIEVFARVLPLEDHLLDLPGKTIIAWLNILPSMKSYQLLGGSGYGFALTKGYWPLPFTASDRTLDKYGQDFRSANVCVQELNPKFENRVYIKAGPYAEPKYHKKYIIFDIETVGI